jgi:membrane-associated phospholipid phosphatase
MLDSAATRLAASKARVPEYILDFLILLTMLTCFYIGYEGRSMMDWIALIGFTFMLALTIKTIIDLDRPRRGAITLHEANQQIVELQELFK